MNDQQQVLQEIKDVITQLPERQKWQTEVIADLIRTLATTNKAEGVLALAFGGRGAGDEGVDANGTRD